LDSSNEIKAIKNKNNNKQFHELKHTLQGIRTNDKKEKKHRTDIINTLI